MKKIVIESSQKTTLRLVGAGEGESGSASNPFGPVRAGLITMQRTKEDQALTELLNCLESKMLEANIKSLKVLDTLINDTVHRANLGSSFSDTTTTNG